MQDGVENQSTAPNGDGSSHQFSDIAQDIKERTAAARGELREQAQARANHWRDGALGTVSQVVDALNAAASKLQDGQPWLAEPVARMAERVDGYVEAGREKSLTEIRSDLEDMTRRNPVLVVGGAIALGFAISRVLKSSQSGHYSYAKGRQNGRFDSSGMEAGDDL